MQCVDSRLDHDLKLVEIRYRHLSQNQAGLRSVAVDSGLRFFFHPDKCRFLRFGSLETLWRESWISRFQAGWSVNDRLMDLCNKPRAFFHQKSLRRWRVRPNLHQEPGAAKDAARAAKVQWDISSVWGPGSYPTNKKLKLETFFLEGPIGQFLCFFFWELQRLIKNSTLQVKGGLIASIV